jgi:hypothetical protein
MTPFEFVEGIAGAALRTESTLPPWIRVAPVATPARTRPETIAATICALKSNLIRRCRNIVLALVVRMGLEPFDSSALLQVSCWGGLGGGGLTLQTVELPFQKDDANRVANFWINPSFEDAIGGFFEFIDAGEKGFLTEAVGAC